MNLNIANKLQSYVLDTQSLLRPHTSIFPVSTYVYMQINGNPGLCKTFSVIGLGNRVMLSCKLAPLGPKKISKKQPQ